MEDKFLIKGLGGERKLVGEINVSGAKNAVLKAMAGTILFKGPVRLKNVPFIEDVLRMSDLLLELGASVEREGDELLINSSGIKNGYIRGEIGRQLRASIVLSGPLLARFGKISFPHPGGCVIGVRPIDLFLDGFKKMGASISVRGEGSLAEYIIKAKGGRLRGAEIFFKNQSVTGTETFLLAGVLAEGETVIKNAALEPEIESLANFLKKAGVHIEGIGTTTLRIKGGEMLSGAPDYETPPDRIETGSFLILASLVGKDLTIKNCEPKHVESLIETLSSCGVKMSVSKNSIKVFGKQGDFSGINIKTHEYPGFPTDVQAPMAVFLTQAIGESLLFETIFEGRLGYAEALSRMGANIVAMDTHKVLIKGKTPLRGQELESPDIRAGLAFVIAAIVAKGDSVIGNVYRIDRGYERVEERLRKVGVSIVRVAK